MTRLLLVGAGHAHLHVLARNAELRAAGVELTVVADPHFAYSGMAAAVAGGAVGPAANRIDVAALCRRHGVRHVVGRAVGLDHAGRVLTTDTGARVATDLLSLNVGSDAATGDIDVGDDVLRVKPLVGLAGLPRLVDQRPPGAEIAVVGGGASATELAANLARRTGPGAVHVYSRTPTPVPVLPDGLRRRIARHLDDLGVRWHHTEVAAVGDGVLTTVEGDRHRADVAVVAVGLAPSRTVRDLGLADDTGHLPADAHLRHPDHDWVFGAGDAARFLPRPLPKIGVFGVRAGPVLVDVVRAVHRGAPPPTYRPQDTFLAILDLATTGLATHGARAHLGRAALLLKRAIDRRWLARYR